MHLYKLPLLDVTPNRVLKKTLLWVVTFKKFQNFQDLASRKGSSTRLWNISWDAKPHPRLQLRPQGRAFMIVANWVINRFFKRPTGVITVVIQVISPFVYLVYSGPAGPLYLFWGSRIRDITFTNLTRKLACQKGKLHSHTNFQLPSGNEALPPLFLNGFYRVGPPPVVSRVMHPFIGVIIPVTHV